MTYKNSLLIKSDGELITRTQHKIKAQKFAKVEMLMLLVGALLVNLFLSIRARLQQVRGLAI